MVDLVYLKTCRSIKNRAVDLEANIESHLEVRVNSS